MAWDTPSNDKKWEGYDLSHFKVALDNINSAIKHAEYIAKEVLEQRLLTFMRPLDKIELLTDLKQSLDKLDNAKATVECWERSPDIYKA